MITRPEYIRFCGYAKPVASPPTTKECVPHTPAPEGYLAWHEWAERKARTHVQERCPGCGLWKVWRPKKRRKAGTHG